MPVEITPQLVVDHVANHEFCLVAPGSQLAVRDAELRVGGFLVQLLQVLETRIAALAQGEPAADGCAHRNWSNDLKFLWFRRFFETESAFCVIRLQACVDFHCRLV